VPGAEEAASTRNREGHDNSVADREIRHVLPKLDDLTHELVAKDVALFHRRNESIVKMEIRSANRSRSDPNNRVSRIDDFGFRHRFDAHIVLAVPTESSHKFFPLL
jgi:hypothetical protein